MPTAPRSASWQCFRRKRSWWRWWFRRLEIGQRAGVELNDEAIGNIQTVRDLLREMSEAEAGGKAGPPPLERPEEVLNETQKRWLDPLTPVLAALARWGYALDRVLMR